MAAERLLVVGPSWVGDMVMAQSLFKTLAARFPGADIDVVAPGWSVPIVARMPEIRHAVVLDTGHGEFGLGKRRDLAATLKSEQYTQAIVLPRSMKAALVPWFAGIPQRTGFRGEMRFGVINDIRPFDKSVLDQTVKRFVALGLAEGAALPEELPQPELRVDAERQQALVESLQLPTGQPVVAMMPGAEYGPAKCWPLEHFTALANELTERDISVWLLGSGKDREAGDVIASGSQALNLCGQTSLEDVIDVLALAGQAVSNDSGLMHVAAAVGCHVHGLYGSSSPDFTPPLTHHRTIHYLDLDCSPCFERECPLGHLDCLKKLDISRVLVAIEREMR